MIVCFKFSSPNQQQSFIQTTAHGRARSFQTQQMEDPECLMRSDGFSLVHAAVKLMTSSHLESSRDVSFNILNLLDYSILQRGLFAVNNNSILGGAKRMFGSNS